MSSFEGLKQSYSVRVLRINYMGPLLFLQYLTAQPTLTLYHLVTTSNEFSLLSKTSNLLVRLSFFIMPKLQRWAEIKNTPSTKLCQSSIPNRLEILAQAPPGVEILNKDS